jgi:hypothetical protein
MGNAVKSALLAVLGTALCVSLSGRALAQGTCGCMDIALVIDDTGSMGGAISNVESGLNAIISMAQTVSGGDLRMSLVSFPNDSPVVRQTMTTNLADEMTAVNNLSAFGGGNEPEASDESLRLVVTGASNCTTTGGPPGAFRPACLKIAILVTDAHPGGCDDAFTSGVDDVAAAQVASLAAAAGVRISAVYVPTFGVDPTIVPIMQTYATTSGGQYSQVNQDGTGTADAIMNIIETCGGAGASPPHAAPALSWTLLVASFFTLAGWGTWRISRTNR